MNTSTRFAITLGAFALACAVQAAPQREPAANAKPAAKAQQQDWGIAGDARAARRTIEIGMSDALHFTPSRLQLREGETVRFVVVNRGRQPHQFAIATRKVLDANAALMRRFPQMDQDEPNAVHVAPGRRKTLVWTFNRPGEFAFACLVPGHYEAGMTGSIKVMSRKH